MKSVNKCLYCEKLYTTKQNTIVHMKKCSSKTLFEENKKLKEELEQIKIELTKKNELLNFFKSAKDTNQINTTNNTQNNITINTTQPLKDIISSLQPINFEEMKKLWWANRTAQYGKYYNMFKSYPIDARYFKLYSGTRVI